MRPNACKRRRAHVAQHVECRPFASHLNLLDMLELWTGAALLVALPRAAARGTGRPRGWKRGHGRVAGLVFYTFGVLAWLGL